MDAIMKFISNYFNINVLVLCFISSIFLIYIDGKEYKKHGLMREYKFSISIAFFYIIGGLILYVSSLFIRV